MSTAIPPPDPPQPPQTHKRGRSRADSESYSFSSSPTTPLASPGADAASVFSPSDSVYTDVTEYDWESPSRNPQEQDEKIPSFSSLETRLEAATNVPDVENTPDVFAHEPNEATDHAQYADAPNTRIKITVEEVGPEEHEGTSNAGVNQPTAPQKLFEGLIGDENVRNRRCSFNAEPVLDFLQASQTHRRRPRAKSVGAAKPETTGSFIASQLSAPLLAVHLSQEDDIPQEAAVREVPSNRNAAAAAAAVNSISRETLGKLIPESVKDYLIENGVECVATTLKDRRCTKKAPTPDLKVVFDILNNFQGDSNIKHLLETSKKLFGLLLCTIHQKVATRLLEALVRPAAVVLEEWLIAVRGASSSTAYIPPLETRYNTALPDFNNYNSTLKAPGKSKSVSQQLEDLLVLPLTTTDVNHSGHIYIFQWKGKFGYHKIGYTTNLAARLLSWEKQCGRELTSDFPRPTPAGEQVPVPHIRRVEGLIHTELGPYRRKETNCPGCSRSHQEWFDIDQELAMRVVRKWISWIREQPYVQVNGGSTAQPIRNRNNRAVGKLLAHDVLNHALRPLVYVTAGIVDEDDSFIGEDCARDAEELALAVGEFLGVKGAVEAAEAGDQVG
ncbi:meiotically up-regulated gene 113-domain-containing protein [Aspergillus crustosus]